MRRNSIVHVSVGLVGLAVLIHCGVSTEVDPSVPDGGVGIESGVDAPGPEVDASTADAITNDVTVDASNDAPLDASDAADAAPDAEEEDAGPPPPPAPPYAVGTTIRHITAGRNHTCVLWTDGVAQCWGDNTYGQLGVGDRVTRGRLPGQMAILPAVAAPPGRLVTRIKAGGNRTCVWLDNPVEVRCFGENTSGELGHDDVLSVLAPTRTSPEPAVMFGNASCAGLECWGNNAFGQLGHGDTAHRGDNAGEMAGLTAPFVWPGPTLGYGPSASHTCAWTRTSPKPNPSPNDPSWRNRLTCWGKNDKGQLGLGDTQNRGDQPGELPTEIELNPTVASVDQSALDVALGAAHTCALARGRYTQAISCWGDNSRGQLGLGDTQNRGDQPNEMGAALPLSGGLAFIRFDERFQNPAIPHISAGAAFTCTVSDSRGGYRGLKTTCWGANESGQLGFGDNVDRLSAPGTIIDVGTNKVVNDPGYDSSLRSFATGEQHVCVVVRDACATQAGCAMTAKDVKCWGKNDKGQLGLGDTQNRGDQPNEMGDTLPFVQLRAAAP